MGKRSLLPKWLLLVGVLGLTAAAARGDDLADQLRRLDGAVIPAAEAKERNLTGMLSRDARARLQAANQRSSDEWRAVQKREDWERFRDARLAALRASLGSLPPAPADLKLRVTGTVKGEGYQIDNIVFEGRPGLLVTGNLYRPAEPRQSMPGLLLCHSHHAPKTQGELQDMGMTWARQGCLVLAIDHVGHGERRQHPFREAASFP